MGERVTVDIKGHIAHVRMTRADKMNALDVAMFEALAEAGDAVRAAQGVRAVVLSGEGRGFCAGIDLQSLGEGGFGALIKERRYDGANLAQHVVVQWRKLPVPVIAALHGAALGGGFQIALGADIRIAHRQTKLGLLEVKWGLVPDMAGMTLLPALVGADVIADIVFRARTFDAAEGHRLGLVTHLSDNPVEEALTLAADIASKSPDAVRAAKKLLTQSSAAHMQAMLEAESAALLSIAGKPNQREAVAAGLGNRAATFAD